MNSKTIRAALTGGILAALAVTALGAQESATTDAKARKAPRPSSPARIALAGAKAVHDGARGKKGAERKAILDRAVAAYLKVAQDFAGEPIGAAPAWFAAAEIRRNDVPVTAFFRSNGFVGGSFVQLELDLGEEP
jgi:hypothetical protein